MADTLKGIPVASLPLASEIADDDQIITYRASDSQAYRAPAEDLASNGNISDTFSTSTSYAVGDYCIYNNTLYKCTTAHSGAWNASHFTAVKVAEEISELNTNFFQLKSTDGKAISSGDDINKLLTVGNYYVTNNATAAEVVNLPCSNGGLLKILQPLGNTNYLTQIYMAYTNEIYIRRWVSTQASNDGWYDWYQLDTVQNVSSNLVHVESGSVSFSNVEAGSYGDVNVTFDTEFEETPYIVISLSSNTTATGYGNVTFTTVSRSTTGFTARCLNGMGSTSTSPNAHWIATR